MKKRKANPVGKALKKADREFRKRVSKVTVGPKGVTATLRKPRK